MKHRLRGRDGRFIKYDREFYVGRKMKESVIFELCRLLGLPETTRPVEIFTEMIRFIMKQKGRI